MKDKIIKLVFNFKFILLIYIILVLSASVQSYFSGPKAFNGSDIHYTHYNNYLIFKKSFFHLIKNQDLYALFPLEHWDLYKYSPTFALLFAPLAILPDFLGLILWNLLNAILLLLAIAYLPEIDKKKRILILWFILIELMTSLQNGQSNGLIAGLVIFSLVFFERKNYLVASFLIVFSAYIKLFAIVAFVFGLMYPQKMKNIGYFTLWSILLGLLPLFVISFHQLEFLYASWGKLLATDHSASYGLSVMGWIYAWFGFAPPKTLILSLGIALFCVPLIQIKLYKEYSFRLMLLASVLLWVIIFNHKAESPTFIIAISGAAIWYFSQARKPINLVLIIFALLFTVLSPTDIFPPFIRNNIFRPYAIKVVPCIIIWLKIIYDMTFTKPILELSESRTIW